MHKSYPHLSVIMMLKNEEHRLLVSLESIQSIVSSLIIYDTGSTDSTISILTDFCDQNNIPLRLKQGEFIDFSTCRNILLDYADTFLDVDYLLLMDCNDELHHCHVLSDFLLDLEQTNPLENAWMIGQRWWNGIESITYFNPRLIRPRCGWKYVGVVHEYLINSDQKSLIPQKIDPLIYLYQDRTKDDDKSKHRYMRDKELLQNSYTQDPTNERTVFYLAQTYACLQDTVNAYKYYSIRSNMNGFPEETFESMYKCGKIIEQVVRNNPKSELKWSVALVWYMNAFSTFHRIEPLIQMGIYYKDQHQYELAYMYIHLACTLEIPSDSKLFVNQEYYTYERWHQMGIIAYYVGQYEEGRIACQSAIKNKNRDIDHSNLKYYITKE